MRPSAVLRDAVFIQQQPDDDPAVFLHEREQPVHLFFFPGDGVEQRLAVVGAHRTLHCIGVAGIQAERQRCDRLQFLDKRGQDRRLVDVRDADIDVEDLCIAVLLAEAFCEKGIEFALFKRCPHLFTDAGIDPLPDEQRLFADGDRSGERGHHSDVFRFCFLIGNRPAPLHGLADVVRAGAAAAACAGDAHHGELLHVARELVGVDIVEGFPVLAARQPCIRIGDDRQGGNCKDTLDDREHLLRTQAAVHAEGIHAQPFQHADHGLRGTACEHLPVFVKDHRDKDGEAAFSLAPSTAALVS